MSLLRHRASEASVESTRSDRRPAEARAWLVSVNSWRSEVALKVFELHAKTSRGATSNPTVVTPKAIATIATQRRGSRAVMNRGLGAWLDERKRTSRQIVLAGGRMGIRPQPTLGAKHRRVRCAMVPRARRTGTTGCTGRPRIAPDPTRHGR